jgi:hypothetical protein
MERGAIIAPDARLGTSSAVAILTGTRFAPRSTVWIFSRALGGGDARHLGVGFYLDLPGLSAGGSYAVRHAEVALEYYQLVQTQMPPLAGAQVLRRDARVRDPS